MFSLLATLLGSTAIAATVEHDLTWSLTIGGRPAGTRTATIKIAPGESGTHRIVEAFTDIQATVGPARIRARHRMTVHAEGGDPASFHSVLDLDGEASEIQGRFSPGGWTVSTNHGGRLRTAEFSPAHIDLSTADLLDPESRVSFAREGTVRLLFAETGDVVEGQVRRLGASTVTIGSTAVDVQGFRWSSPEGESTFWFSPEGYLVHYTMQIFGVPVEGRLTAPPPAGIDDFPVRVWGPPVETLPL